MDAAAENVIPVEVYNFSDKTMTGSLRGELEENAGTVVFDKNVITVAPMSKATVNAVITPGDAKYDTEYNLTIGGSFDGAEISPCAAQVYYELPQDYTVTKLKYKSGSSDTSDASKWITTNIVGGNAAAVQAGGGVKFTVDFENAGVDNWFYPPFYFRNNSAFKNSSGLSFTITSEAERDDVSINVFVYGGDGMVYFLGEEPYFIEQGTHRYFIRWDKFRRHNLSQSDFDLNKASLVEIGVSTASAGTVEYTLSEVGTYTVN